MEIKEEISIDEGPRKWLIPVIESSYSKMIPREEASTEEHAARDDLLAQKTGQKKRSEDMMAKSVSFPSCLQPGKDKEVLGDIPKDYWQQRLREYQQRKNIVARQAGTVLLPAPRQAAISGINNWVPMGPAVIAHGQAEGEPPIGGRVCRIAISSSGERMYAATANGGVFRSDDSGRSWASTMDGFDTDPNNFASTSLACGAIAISPSNPDRIYLGTGEGDTDAIFNWRLEHALPAYRGIGPIISDDGGDSWKTEPSSPSLAGFAFYDIAVDPINSDNAVAATTNGLYQRIKDSSGFVWQQRRPSSHCSVVVARSGSTVTFYAAAWGGPVYNSKEGSTWSVVGADFPSSTTKDRIGRLALGIQSNNPNVLYALVSDSNGRLYGLYRLDDGHWNLVYGTPNILAGSQGDYDLCIAIDPKNINCIYLGGDRVNFPPYAANIKRCIVSKNKSRFYKCSNTSEIGTHAHADVHTLVFAQEDPNRLWAGTDGGCFLNKNPAISGQFEARNTGLSSLNTNYMGMSLTEPSIIYAGLQDNGTARYAGEELWYHVMGGDGGYCVVHPTEPLHVLVYMNQQIMRTTSGGKGWDMVLPRIQGSLMVEPLIGSPESERVAFGAGSQIFFSDDFGESWKKSLEANSTPADKIDLHLIKEAIYSMVFASDTRIFIGTTNGKVYRVDSVNDTWKVTRIDNAVAGALGFVGLVSDIAVDWSDVTLQSVYVCFGGIGKNGDFRHVWRFNGVLWEARSGSNEDTRLIDVEHNAIVVDPANPSHVYVGTDVAVWHSSDSGNNWTLMQTGLPDAPVFDLQIHNKARLLRASTHGRGLYEIRLDPHQLTDIELYIRHDNLNLVDPKIPAIKIDVPTPEGYKTPTNQIDFLDFHETIKDGSDNVATIDPPLIVHNRVYVLVHNRGPFSANSVRVMATIANVSAGLRPLPQGYASNVQAGTPITGPNWGTLGTITINNLRAGFPQVAAFDLPSTLLPSASNLSAQSNFRLVVFIHSNDDPFTATEQNTDILVTKERKVGQRDIHVTHFTGIPPSIP